jgi:periplasmic divalent cation tolerance protein
LSGRIAQLVTTVDTREKAESIAKDLIEANLAACVQIDGPVSSSFRWQGVIDHALEFRLTIKTTLKAIPYLQEELKRIHPYEIPEILIQEMEASDSYWQWVQNSVMSEF